MALIKESFIVAATVASAAFVVYTGWVATRPRPIAACDDATKPLVIECVAHGGARCIEQVQTLNGCVFK